MSPTKKEVHDLIRLSASTNAYDFFFMDDWDWVYDRLVSMGINTDKRWAAFLGTLRHESGGFRVFVENLNYSAKRLMQVWPSRFKSKSQANKYARNPKALANYVYNGRMGNRVGTNDGWNYRGQGLIQLTGRNNAIKYTRRLGIDLIDNPEQLQHNSRPMWLVAADYFCARRIKGKTLLEHADEGNLRLICKAVNGGFHGLADRITWSTFYEAGFRNDGQLAVRTLCKRGDRGSLVKQVQYILAYINGIADKTYRYDGIFGKNTEKSVIEFQTKNGLVPDGMVGTRTYYAMFAIYDQLLDLEDD